MKQKSLDVSKLSPGTPLVWLRDTRKSGAVVERIDVRFVRMVNKKCVVEVTEPLGTWKHEVQVTPQRLRLPE
jgi:hypothetical protein